MKLKEKKKEGGGERIMMGTRGEWEDLTDGRKGRRRGKEERKGGEGRMKGCQVSVQRQRRESSINDDVSH